MVEAAVNSYGLGVVGARGAIVGKYATVLHDTVSEHLRLHQIALLNHADTAYEAARKMENDLYADIYGDTSPKDSESKFCFLCHLTIN